MPHVRKQELPFRFTKPADNKFYWRNDSTDAQNYCAFDVRFFPSQGFVMFDMTETKTVKGKTRHLTRMNCCCSIESFNDRFTVSLN